MPRINSLKIRKLGNVAPGTELKFDPRGAVLLGRNGTGKTTLLEMLASICRADFSTVGLDDYEIEFSMSCAENIELNVTAKRDQPIPSPGSELSSKGISKSAFPFQRHAGRPSLRIEARDSASGERTIIESNDSQIICTFPDGEHITQPAFTYDGWGLLGLGAFRENTPTTLFLVFQELLLQSTSLRRFDEGLDYFRSLTERNPTSACIEALGYKGTYGLALDSTRLISRNCADLLLEDFRKNETRATAGLSDSSEIKYLELFCRLAGFGRARIGADLDEKHQEKELELVRLSPLRFSLERNGSVLHHDHLSFGQRRLLAFLHYQDSTPDLVIADELVNGMHHDWISECLRLMQSSQAFLSSQNPLLFDFLTFESPEEVANRFVICELDDQHRFVWRNMSESDAVEFYETHKVGLQHASEILRTRGYW